jgi:hypothetical protein
VDNVYKLNGKINQISFHLWLYGLCLLYRHSPQLDGHHGDCVLLGEEGERKKKASGNMSVSPH